MSKWNFRWTMTAGAALVIAAAGAGLFIMNVGSSPAASLVANSSLQQAAKIDPVTADDPAVPARRSVPELEVTSIILSVVTRGCSTTIPGALVNVEGTVQMDGDHRTDRDGRVRFPVGTFERGSATVSAAGHFTERVLLSDLARTADPHSTCVMALGRSADLLVRVLDQGGRPIQDAFVTAYPFDPRTSSKRAWQGWWPSFRRPGSYTAPFSTPEVQRAGTDDRGEVRLLQLPRELPLLISASGPIAPTTGVITIDQTVELAELELRGDLGAAIVGRLQYEDGSPAASVGVSFHVTDNLVQSKRASTQQDGSLRVVGMQEGRTSWQVDSVGTPLSVVDVVYPVTDLGTITIPRATEITGFIEVSEGCSRAGQFSLTIDVVKEGQRVAELRPRPIGPGRMEFWGIVPEGRLELRAASRLIVLDSATVIAPSTDVITLSTVARMAALELHVEGSTEGQALDALIVPLDDRGARATRRGVIAASTVAGQMVIERDGGKLVLGCLPPGNWDVEISAGSSGGAVVAGLQLAPGAREVRRVDLGWSTIQCTVRAPSGELLDGVDVGLVQGRDSPPDLRTDESGSALFSGVRPGRITVFPAITGPHSGHAVDLVAEPGRIHSVELVVGNPTTLRGVVRRNGEPEEDAHVEAWARLERSSLGRWRRRSVTTDSTGVFALSGVIPGEYEIVARSNLERGPELTNHCFVNVTEGQSPLLEMDLITDERTSFLVVNEHGTPLKGMRYGYATARSGIGSLQLDPQVPGRLQGGPNQGPWLLQIATESYLGSASPLGDGEGSLVVLVPESAPTCEWGRVASIGQGSLKVLPCADSGVAHVREVQVAAIPGAEGLVHSFDPIQVQFRRVNGELQLEGLPEGAVLRLVGVGKNGEWPTEARVVVQGATTTYWPPTDGQL